MKNFHIEKIIFDAHLSIKVVIDFCIKQSLGAYRYFVCNWCYIHSIFLLLYYIRDWLVPVEITCIRGKLLTIVHKTRLILRLIYFVIRLRKKRIKQKKLTQLKN